MKSIFEQMGGTYRQEGDYLIPNLSLPDESEYQIGKYGRMRRSYLKEHRPVLYASLLTSGTLHRHLAEIDQACNERMAIIVSDMARQEDVTEALKAAGFAHGVVQVAQGGGQIVQPQLFHQHTDAAFGEASLVAAVIGIFVKHHIP